MACSPSSFRISSALRQAKADLAAKPGQQNPGSKSWQMPPIRRSRALGRTSSLRRNERPRADGQSPHPLGCRLSISALNACSSASARRKRPPSASCLLMDRTNLRSKDFSQDCMILTPAAIEECDGFWVLRHLQRPDFVTKRKGRFAPVSKLWTAGELLVELHRQGATFRAQSSAKRLECGAGEGR